jgi:hypothetical protein
MLLTLLSGAANTAPRRGVILQCCREIAAMRRLPSSIQNAAHPGSSSRCVLSVCWGGRGARVSARLHNLSRSNLQSALRSASRCPSDAAAALAVQL